MITTSADWSEVKFNGTDIAQVNFNGVKVWEKGSAQGIYGVSWLKSKGTTAQPASSQMTRTDDATNFSATAYVNDGSTPGSSSFDSIMPWSGIVRETLNGDEMVKIPKFWYKYEDNGTTISIKIANYAETGFTVSPAHQARDGHGELDYFYVGRYACNTAYKSLTGQTSFASAYIGTTRAQCRARGAGYQQMDMAARMTIQLLYLVEYADWNSANTIGRGAASVYTSGGTDNMPYHTGTTAASLATGTNYIQYRYLEGAMCIYPACWVDGFQAQNTTLYGWLNCSDYNNSVSYSTNRIVIGSRPAVSSTYSQGKLSDPGATFLDTGKLAAFACGTRVANSSSNFLGIYSTYANTSDPALLVESTGTMISSRLVKLTNTASQQESCGARLVYYGT